MQLLPDFSNVATLFSNAPTRPFTQLAGIVFRAKTILKNMPEEQINLAFEVLDKELVTHFESLRAYAIDELQVKFESDPETYQYFFRWDGGTFANGRWLFRNELDTELDIETAENSSWVDALKEIIEDRDSWLNAPEESRSRDNCTWQEFENSELFAVLSLGLVACSVIPENQDEYPKGQSIAATCALEAMDAVCYAEQCREIEWIKQFHAKQLLETSNSQLAKLQEVTEEISSKLVSEQAEHERLKRAERSAQMNSIRHQPTKEARDLVIKDWEANFRSFPSAEQAGVHYSDWLAEKSMGYLVKGQQEFFKPRAVAEWIRQHAKVKNIKFR